MNRSRRHAILFGVALLSIFAFVVGRRALLRSSAPRPAAPAPSSERPAERTIHWPADKVLVYTVHHRARQAVDLPRSGDSLTGAPAHHEEVAIEVDADLVLQRCSEDTAVTWLGAKLENVRKLRLLVGGQDKLSEESGDGAAFASSEAYLAVSPAGQLHAVAFPRGANGSYQRVMQHLLQQIAVVVSSESTWQTSEESPFGLATTIYRRTQAERSLLKQRVSLEQRLPLLSDDDEPAVRIASRFDITLAEGNYVHDLVGGDRLTVPAPGGVAKELGSANTELHLLALRDAKPWAMPSSEQLSLRPAGAAYVAPEEQRAWLEQRAAGISFDQVYEAASHVTDSAAFPGHQEFLVRATAYLALHPEDCAKLAPLFIDPDAGSVRRGFVLDLLVSTDTSPAQAELRRLLQTPEAIEDGSADMLLQRLSFVHHPDPETAALVTERFASATGQSRYASAYAMGAMIHHLNDDAKPAEARDLNRQMLEAIDAAPNDSDRAQLVRSLSGARVAENVGPLSRYAESQDPSVRAAVAFAVRQTQSRESERIVLKLAADKDTQVQGEALRTMAQYSLDDGSLQQMVGLTTDKTIETELFGDVYNVLANYQESKPDLVKDAAQKMLAQSVADRDVRVRLQFMANGI